MHHERARNIKYRNREIRSNEGQLIARKKDLNNKTICVLEETTTEKSISITPPEVSWLNGYINFKEIIDDFENTLITPALKMTKGNKKAAASILTLKRTTLLEKIKKKGLHNNWQEPKE